MLAGLLFDRLTKESKPAVALAPQRCLRARFSGSNCTACINECHQNALALDGKTISLDSAKCSGCLRCSAVCPNDAFVDGIRIESLLDLVGEDKTVVLTCGKGRQCEGKVAIPCIGFISEPILASLNALSSGNVVLNVEGCEKCVNGHCLGTLRRSLSNLAVRSPDRFVLKIRLALDRKELPMLDRMSARRLFLKNTGQSIAHAGTDLVKSLGSDDKVQPGQFEKNPARNSVALNYALKHLKDENDRELLLSYYHGLQASEDCHKCPLCSGMCPTGALKRLKTDSSRQLVFDTSLCSGCGLCLEFCKKDYLTLFQGNTDLTGTAVVIA